MGTHGSTPRDRAVRGLAFYFLRIILVFLGVWLPMCVIAYMLAPAGEIQQYFNAIAGKGEEGVVEIVQLGQLINGFLFCIQRIITFCMVLTKDDVKKYIK